jgi:hypothetical protein
VRLRLGLLLTLCLFPLLAFAQSGPQVSGQLVPGHALRVLTPNGNVVGDAGGAAGSTKPGSGYLTEMGITNMGTPFCVNDSLINSPLGYHQLCMGANKNGSGELSYNAFGSAPQMPFNVDVDGPLNINSGGPVNFSVGGIVYPFPSPGDTSATHITTQAALASYSGTQTTLIRDGFYVPGDGGAAVYTLTNGACSLNAGAGDGGSQVPFSGGGKCWAAYIGNSTSVRLWGAKGDGSTDDTAAFQNAVNAITSITGGGTLTIPRGYYCIKSGPIVINQQGFTLQGENYYGSTVLDACGADDSIVKMTGYHDVIDSVQIVGADKVGTTNPAVIFSNGGGAAEGTVRNSFISKGCNAISANSYELYVLWSRLEYSYCDATIYLQNTGGYIIRDKMDNAYPVAGWPSSVLSGFNGITVNNWAASTSYTANTIVASGNYLLQALNGGTSGTLAPVIPKFGAVSLDGSVTWGLVSTINYSSIQCDSGCGSVLYIAFSDFSSAGNSAIRLSNSQSGGMPPHYVVISNNNMAFQIYDSIRLDAGYDAQVSNNTFGTCLLTNCGNISTDSAWQGDLIVTSNNFSAPPSSGNNLFLFAGHLATITGNEFGSAATAVSIGPNLNDYTITGNTFRSVFGSPRTGVFVQPGSGDYITIANNNFHAVTLPLSTTGVTGTHLVTTPNVGP